MEPAGEPPMLSVDQVREALQDVVTAMQTPENLQRVENGLAEAGGDPMRRLMILTPIVLDIEKHVIAKYGFTADQAGVMRFLLIVKQYEATDPEIKILSDMLKTKFLPPGMAF